MFCALLKEFKASPKKSGGGAVGGAENFLRTTEMILRQKLIVSYLNLELSLK